MRTMDRRTFIKQSMTVPAAAVVAAQAIKSGGIGPKGCQRAGIAGCLRRYIPTSKIGDMTVSRILLGGNIADSLYPQPRLALRL